MFLRRLFQISVVLAVLYISPVPQACVAHPGGHPGGSGGSAGSSHSSYSPQHYSGSANWSHSPGSANWSHGPNSPNFHSPYHAYGGADWGYHDWNHYFHGAYWGPGWNGWWGWGYPFWFSYWGGYPFGWGGYYADYFYPYGQVYATGYPAAYYYSYPDDGQYAANLAPNAANPAGAPQPAAGGPQAAVDHFQPAVDNGEATANEALQYYNDARSAFTRGDYRNALRLAGHSAVESPQNAKVHELTSLALFASGEYRGAATEAHAALVLGEPSDWPHLYAYYNDSDRYSEQLRKLEKTVSDVPTSAPGHFLLGYHYLMTGAKAEAKSHFAQAAKLTPNDKLAQHILKQLESGSAVTPPQLPKQPTDEKGQQL